MVVSKGDADKVDEGQKTTAGYDKRISMADEDLPISWKSPNLWDTGTARQKPSEERHTESARDMLSNLST